MPVRYLHFLEDHEVDYMSKPIKKGSEGRFRDPYATELIEAGIAKEIEIKPVTFEMFRDEEE